MNRMQKSILFRTYSLPLRQLGLFIYSGTVAEGGDRHATFLCGFCAIYFSGSPALVDAMEVFRQRRGWAAKADTARFGRRDALCLALPDVYPLVFCNEGENLEHNIAEKRAHQILAAAGVQQGHI